MNMTNWKKLFALCLACVMTLCLFAACGKEPATQANPETTGSAIKDPIPVGTMFVSAGASVTLSYDTDGLVIKLYGSNEEGLNLANNYTDYLGKPCATVIKEVIGQSAKAGYLAADVKSVIVKRFLRSQEPTEFFMETIETEAKAALEAAGSAAELVLVQADEMDGTGNLTLATVKKLLSIELGVEQLDKYYGSAVPVDGAYICTVEVGGQQYYYKIDAFTGFITEATEQELLGDPSNNDESFEDDLTIDQPVVEDILPSETEEDLLN